MPWHDAGKSEFKNLGGNQNFENSERKNNFEVEKVGRKNYGIWNHKYSISIRVDKNHTDSNQPIPGDLTNIGSIHDSANIRAIENTLSTLVHFVHTTSLVPASPIFTYVAASDPPSPQHDSSAERVTPKVNPTPLNNPPNPVPNVPADPDSDPSLSDSYSSDSSESSHGEYYKRRRLTKNNKNKCQSKTSFDDPIKTIVKLTAKLPTAT